MPNHLASETSPYLLQHADNPVDWRAWGPEAMAEAVSSDRPILLSIGYSACHWCHVMERESFEDPDTAELMNEGFVNVKVDREERPDVDAVYMRAVQSLTGQGGWPLTVFLTPTGEPFYGGTYFPPTPRHGLPSFRQVLEATRSAYQERRADVVRASVELVSLLERGNAPSPKPADGPKRGEGGDLGAVVEAGEQFLTARFDPVHGGFGRAPKFPQPMTLEFLLRWQASSRGGERRQTLQMVVHTLRRMARGGMRDHLGGGFHRYSVDERWLVPHFEKMLYDNGLLARLYLQAWQVTGEVELREVAESTLDWILTDMQSPEGGFYAARDADSEGEEGLFYIWTPGEIRDLLPPEEAELFCRFYDVSPVGNFEGHNILHIPHDPDAIARSEGVTQAELTSRLASGRTTLLAARAHREHPARDEKVLASWNGFVVRALAEAGGALGRPDYTDAAMRALDFVLSDMRRGDRLLRSWTAGSAKIDGFLEDYAAIGNALLTVYETTLDSRWLTEVEWAGQAILERFHDPDAGVLYDTAADATPLVIRPRETMDNATPSGTSLAIELLQRAGRLLGRERWTSVATEALGREADALGRYPSAFGRMLSLALTEAERPLELALLGPVDHPDFRALHDCVLARYLPTRTLVGGEAEAVASRRVPLLEGRGPVEGRPTIFICRDLVCLEPVTDVATLRRELDAIGGAPPAS